MKNKKKWLKNEFGFEEFYDENNYTKLYQWRNITKIVKRNGVVIEKYICMDNEGNLYLEEQVQGLVITKVPIPYTENIK